MKKTLLLLLAAATLVVPCTLTSCGGGGGGANGTTSSIKPETKFLANKTIEIYRPGTDKFTIILGQYIGTKHLEGRFMFGTSEINQGILTIDNATYDALDTETPKTLNVRFSLASSSVTTNHDFGVFLGLIGFDEIVPQEDFIIELTIDTQALGGIYEGTANGSGLFRCVTPGIIYENVEGKIENATMFIRSH